MAAAKAKRRFSEQTHDALKNVRELAGDRVKYRTPGESLTLPGVPGIRIYILGPPQNERMLRNINPSKRKPQTYTQRSDALSRRSRGPKNELTEKEAFTLALRGAVGPGVPVLPLTDSEKEIFQRCFPFEQRFRVTKQEAAQTHFFRAHYGFTDDMPVSPAPHPLPPAGPEPIPLKAGPDWRRIDEMSHWGLAAAPKRDAKTKSGKGAAKRRRAEDSRTRQDSAPKPKQTPAHEPLPDDVPEKFHPFDRHLRISVEEAARMPFFWEHYGFAGNPPCEMRSTKHAPIEPSLLSMGPAWRRIDTDWLGVATELALQMDSYTNNTSLAMAIELVGTGKVLLFPADAQVGNWLSWDTIAPTFTGAEGKSFTAADLLRRTVFYKVGHHGSHNATMREVGLERMVSPELVAFVPVDERVAREVRNWRDMPFGPLLARLYETTKGRVIRLDHGVVTEHMPEFLSDDIWQQIAKTAQVFRDEQLQSGGHSPDANGGDRSLYFQLVITDDPPR
jgi:hypothetical protein